MKPLADTMLTLASMLSDGSYHDGDSLGSSLGMTRAGVWKLVKKLQAYDIAIESVKGKGYAMPEPLMLLDSKAINQALPSLQGLEIAETLDSTNRYIREYIGTKVPRIVMSEHQKAGRGRLERQWHAPFGQNIYLSLLYPFQKTSSELAGLSMVVGLAILSALTPWVPKGSLSLKWPNDVISDQRKLAGNLIEIYSEANGVAYAIIGVGLNVNMRGDGHPIDQPWTSLRAITGRSLNRNHIAVALITALLESLGRFDREGFMPFHHAWNEHDMLRDKSIHVTTGGERLEGIARGIDDHGNLLLAVEGQAIRRVAAGDAHIRKAT